ncbi:MAG TPA: hypothetical protein PLF59_08140 [Cyclobacteriaceae bacterium]|nr:hypothetical protein [Cyclobacteriaceae bacterium]
MPIANFPANLAAAIQLGYLERRFEDALKAELGYRRLAKQERFKNNIGETLTKTRGGLLPQSTVPLNPAANTNLDNGLSAQYWTVEQFSIAINEYAQTLDLNVVTQKVGIADQFLQNATKLGESSRRSIDIINRDALFAAYLGGNTRVRVSLGAPAATISVDDITGFEYAIPTSGANSGKPNIPVSPSNTLPVQVGSNIYTLITATPDVTNVSTAFNGISGTLTFSTNVTVLDGAALNAVVSAYAPLIVRPNNRATTAALQPTDILTLDNCRQAVEQLYNNNVPGPYTLTIAPASLTELYKDPEFQILFRGTEFKSEEYRNFWISHPVLGFDIIVTNMAPQQTLNGIKIQRPILTGEECLIEAMSDATDEILSDKYGDELHDVSIVNDIAMVTRGQLDRLKQIIAQSWFFIGGWTAPTDQTISSLVIPTASSAYYKRAVVIETA